MHYCYILHSTLDKNTYNGYTIDVNRRIRQHNSEIKGGAKFTTGRHSQWTYLLISELCGSGWTYKDSLSFEWHIKYPTNRRPRPKVFNGSDGRLQGFLKALEHIRFTSDVNPEKQMNVYVADDYFDYFQELVYLSTEADKYKNILSINKMGQGIFT